MKKIAKKIIILKNKKLLLLILFVITATAAFLLAGYGFSRGAGFDFTKVVNRRIATDGDKQQIAERLSESKALKVGFITDAHCYGEWKKDGTWKTNWRCANPMERFIKQMNQDFHPDFVLQNGDLADGKNGEPVKNFQVAKTMLEKLKAPVYHVLGNHEAQDFSKSRWLELVGYQKTYYTFDIGNYQIFVLDANYIPVDMTVRNSDSLEDVQPTTDNFYPGALPAEQLKWLEETLKTSTAKQKLVFIHQPPVEKTLIKKRSSLLMNGEELREILAKYQVKAVFAGHIEELCALEERGVNYYILPGFHKENKTLDRSKSFKDSPLFAELTFEKGRVKVQVFRSYDRGVSYQSWALDQNSAACNNKSIEQLKQTEGETEKTN